MLFVGAAAALLANAVYTGTMASDIANRKKMEVDLGVLKRLEFKVILFTTEIVYVTI